MDRTITSIIFDLDGTLVDSQPAALEAAVQALAPFGVHVTAAQVRERFGGGTRNLLWGFLAGSLTADEAEGAIDEATQTKNRLQVEYTERVILLPNAKQLLDLLREDGYKIALATMAARDVVDEVSSYHGLAEYFDCTVTADDVVHGKPDPEMLTKTVGLLGGQVDNSLYIGDSTHDLEAAIRLGMPFLLADTGIYIRGEARESLRGIAEGKGYSVVGIDDLLDIFEIVRNLG